MFRLADCAGRKSGTSSDEVACRVVCDTQGLASDLSVATVYPEVKLAPTNTVSAGQPGAAHFIPILVVPMLPITHGRAFRILLQHQKGFAMPASDIQLDVWYRVITIRIPLF
jgi:hypothetical protein